MKGTRGLLPASQRRRIERKQLEQEKAARGERLEEFLRNGGPVDRVVPELIPTEKDRDALYAQIVKGFRLAERQPRGAGRNRKLDALVAPLARLESVERILALDPLQRAALTPQRLAVIAQSITPQDVHTRALSVRSDMLEGEGSR